MKYSYSDDQELFHGQEETLEAAIAEALDNYPEAETVFVGEATQKTIGEYLTVYHVESLLEGLSEAAAEECGEVAEDWLVPASIRRETGEAKEDYQVRINAWKRAKAERLGFLLDGFRIVLETWATDAGEQPSFWHVGNVKSYGREDASIAPPGRVI